MNSNETKFMPTDGANTLAIMLHAYGLTPDVFNDAKTLIHRFYDEKGGVDIYSPPLPYSRKLDSTGADQIVVNLVSEIDAIWENKEYERVIFIGHSLGGILSRRVFLAGAPNPPDYSAGHQFRDDLSKKLTSDNHGWAKQVERIVLLASWDKGWSISARDAPKYSIPLNLLGFWGRLFELIPILPKLIRSSENTGVFGRIVKFVGMPGRTMLDMRLGAPFIVQTRLLWMAYRYWHNKSLLDLYNKENPSARLEAPPIHAVNPLLVQIIGTRDDFVSPQDQVVDYSIEAVGKAAQRSNSHEQKYFMLEMPGADHKGVIDFMGDGKSERGNVFLNALMIDGKPQVIDGKSQVSPYPYTHNPDYFEDIPIHPNPRVKNVVFVMHGIRDDGYWAHRISKAIKEKKPAKSQTGQPPQSRFESWTPTYGYFPMGAFLLPWIRQQKVEWFMNEYVNVKERYPNATLHYVGHSNGTYLAACALKDYPAARFGKIYFAGSVVNPEFDWPEMVEDNRVERFHNVRGATDSVVAFLPKSIEYFSDLGGAGFDGFNCFDDNGDLKQTKYKDNVTQSKHFATGGHHGAISEGHWLEIAKFVMTGKKPFEVSEETSGLFDVKNSCFKFFSEFRIGIPLIFSFALLLAVPILGCWIPPFPFGCWQWGTSSFSFFGEWGLKIWVGSLLAFLILQKFSESKWLRANTNKLNYYAKKFELFLLLVIMFGVANLFLTSFVADAIEFSKLDASHFNVAFRTAGALLSLVGYAALIRFILTRF